MRQTKVNKFIKTLKPKRLRQQAAAIYWFYLRSTPPERLRLSLLKSIMHPTKQIGAKDYMWEKLIEYHSEEKINSIISRLSDIDGRKTRRRGK